MKFYFVHFYFISISISRADKWVPNLIIIDHVLTYMFFKYYYHMGILVNFLWKLIIEMKIRANSEYNTCILRWWQEKTAGAQHDEASVPRVYESIRIEYDLRNKLNTQNRTHVNDANNCRKS